MKTKYVVIISIIFTMISSCKKDVEISIKKPSIIIEEPKVPIIIEQPKFLSFSPKYNYPNSSVGQIKNGYYFPGFYMNNDSLNIKYKLNGYFDLSKCYGDFDDDGLLDLFSFITISSGNEYGKYALISNVLSNSYKIVYYNSKTNFLPIFEVNDYNGDGKLDIIQSNWNSHILFDGFTKKDKIASKLLTFSNNNINVKDITDITDVHDMASGDIDNDNDIDLIISDFTSINASPILYLNDGVGNFKKSTNESFIGLSDIISIRKRYSATTIELMDLNNDGKLDIILGATLNRSMQFDYDGYLNPNAIIYWNKGNAIFDFKNDYSFLPNETIKEISIQNPDEFLGFNFFDYDNDGDMDVFTILTPNYRGFHILVFENLKNKNFKDVTLNVINSYSYTSKTGTPTVFPNGVNGDFPNFFNIRFYDIDSDGDYDMVPDQIANWGGFKYTNNLYWENVNGNYIRKNL